MAKYLDQTGAQHLAEALMASTKTVGGQTIWGSGNIEAGGSDNVVKIYTITNDNDWIANQPELNSSDLKVVIFESDGITSTFGEIANTYNLRNAIIYTKSIHSGRPQDVYMGVIIFGGTNSTFNFYNCKSGGNIDNPQSQYNTDYCSMNFNNCNVNFNFCDMKLDPYAGRVDTLFGSNCNVTLNQTTITGGLNSVFSGCNNVNIGNNCTLNNVQFYNCPTLVVYHTSCTKFERCIFNNINLLRLPSSTVDIYFNHCEIEFISSVTNQDIFNVQYCALGSTVSAYCHPWIKTTQAVSATAAGGWNEIQA